MAKLHTVIIAGKQLVCDSRGRVVGTVLAVPTQDGIIVKPARVQLKGLFINKSHVTSVKKKGVKGD